MRKLWLRVTTRSWPGPRASGSNLEWCVTTYARGTVATFRDGMLGRRAAAEALIGYCASMRGSIEMRRWQVFAAAPAVASLSVARSAGPRIYSLSIGAFV